MYANLNAGNYILRIVANADTEERDVIRRAIRIGKYYILVQGLPDILYISSHFDLIKEGTMYRICPRLLRCIYSQTQ